MRLMIDSSHGLPEASSNMMEQYFRALSMLISKSRQATQGGTMERPSCLIGTKSPVITVCRGIDCLKTSLPSVRIIPSLIVARVMMSVFSIGKNWRVMRYGFFPVVAMARTGILTRFVLSVDRLWNRCARYAKTADNAVATAVIPRKRRFQKSNTGLLMASVFVSRLLGSDFNSSTGTDAAQPA